MEYLFVLAGGFATLFLLIILFNKGKRAEHWYLASMFFLIIISCLYVFKIYQNNGDYYVPFYSELNYAIPLLYGVLLWFYTRSLIKKDFRPKPIDFIHLIPFLLFMAYLLFPLLMGRKSEAQAEMGYPLIKLIINPIYIFLTIKELAKHRKKLLEHFSYVDQMHHYWLSWIAYSGLLLWIVACLGNVFNWLNHYDTQLLGDYFLISFLGVFMFIIAYVGFNRTQIFQAGEHQILDTPELPKMQPEFKIDTSAYVDDYNQLKQLMLEEKPYLDAKLSLHKLSEISGIPQAKLSTTINQMSAQNFYDFVNGYRVDEVKYKLLNEDLEKYSMLGIAEDSGFNSKASFNRIFKKHTGLTPTEFVKGKASS